MPDDTFGAPAAPSISEDVDLLETDVPETDDDEGEKDEPVKVKPPKDDEGEDDEEENKDAENDEDDDKKPPIPFDRPTVKELKTEYPDLFKKFPSLREAYFREIEFTKIFPSVEDAREAVTENEAFSTLSDAALDGDPVPLLSSLESTDKRAFDLFAIGFLPALYKRNQEVYQQVITPVIESLFRNAYKSPDENTRNAALVLAQYMFGDHGDGIAQGKKTLSKVHQIQKEQERLQGERAARVSQQFQAAYGEVSKTISSGLEQMILKDIDPNKTFSTFVRKQLAQDVVKRIFKQLEADEGHKSVMANRWKKAKQNGYSSEDRSKIVSTFLARAKSLIPSTNEKVRSLASGRAKEERVADRQVHKHEVNGGRPSNGRATKTPSRTDLRKMTDMQILEM